jgi:hypothetical protein
MTHALRPCPRAPVHNHQRKAALRHHGSGMAQQRALVLCVVCSRVGHVVQHIIDTQLVAACVSVCACVRVCEWSVRGTQQGGQLKLCASATRACSVPLPHPHPQTHRSAICARRCGRKVPSVSMYSALPSAPPMSIGSCGPCAGTARAALWHVRAAHISIGMAASSVRARARAGARATHLARHAQRVAQLRLAAPELPIQLCDGARLNAPCRRGATTRTAQAQLAVTGGAP